MAIVKKTATNRRTGKKTTTVERLKPISGISYSASAKPRKATTAGKNAVSRGLSTSSARKEQLALKNNSRKKY